MKCGTRTDNRDVCVRGGLGGGEEIPREVDLMETRVINQNLYCRNWASRYVCGGRGFFPHVVF